MLKVKVVLEFVLMSDDGSLVPRLRRSLAKLPLTADAVIVVEKEEVGECLDR